VILTVLLWGAVAGVAHFVLIAFLYGTPLLAAIRVYPRFWNMWIQTTYPARLLVVELVNGSIGTIAIAVFLQAVTQ